MQVPRNVIASSSRRGLRGSGIRPAAIASRRSFSRNGLSYVVGRHMFQTVSESESSSIVAPPRIYLQKQNSEISISWQLPRLQVSLLLLICRLHLHRCSHHRLRLSEGGTAECPRACGSVNHFPCCCFSKRWTARLYSLHLGLALVSAQLPHSESCHPCTERMGS